MAEFSIDKMAKKVAEKAMEELRDNGVFVARWIPVSEETAKHPCLATDKFGQIFIPVGIVTIDDKCYNDENFDFGEPEGYLKKWPKEIVAWMPLPEPYKEGVSE